MLSIRHRVSVLIEAHVRAVGNKAIVTLAPLVVNVHSNRRHAESRIITRTHRLVRRVHRDVWCHRQRRRCARRCLARTRIRHYHLVGEQGIRVLRAANRISIRIRAHVRAVRGKTVVALLPLITQYTRAKSRHTEAHRTPLTHRLVRRIHRDVWRHC